MSDLLGQGWGPPGPMTLHDKTNKQNFLLLIQLRWIAVGGQIVTILF
ncbi:sensor histidine kinase, partial [Mesorhizobium sp. M7A.T.Ca.TU.009.01.1.1]